MAQKLYFLWYATAYSNDYYSAAKAVFLWYDVAYPYDYYNGK